MSLISAGCQGRSREPLLQDWSWATSGRDGAIITRETLDVSLGLALGVGEERDVATVRFLKRNPLLFPSAAVVGPDFPGVGFTGWDDLTGAAASRRSTCCWPLLLTPI